MAVAMGFGTTQWDPHGLAMDTQPDSSLVSLRFLLPATDVRKKETN